jgi:hypothetical protein
MKGIIFKRILILAPIITFTQILFAQQTDTVCKVLMKEISGIYKGDCKNGLADGKGTATGEDTYKGMFREGLPDGKGVYKYKNGNTFSGYWSKGLKNGEGEFKYKVNKETTVITGFWKDGEYVGKSRPDEEYRITNISGIENYSIKKVDGKEDIIEISFEKVMKKYVPRDLVIKTSSGYKIDQNLKVLIQKYSCPVNCSMHFTIPTTGGDRQCNFDFEILKPGKYEVFISNN